MEINIIEHIGKYYCTFVNKNYSTLKDYYNKNEMYYMENSVTFPVYCYLEFNKIKTDLMQQDSKTQFLVGNTSIRDLIKQYPIK